MKIFITFLALAVISISSFSQNELDAHFELENAENELAKENYQQALIHLDKAQEHLGNWSGKISYLKIIAMDNICNYSEEEKWMPLEKEVALYKAYAAKNPDKIDMDKYREIKRIEGAITAARERRSWLDMPEAKKGMEFHEKMEYKDAMIWYRKAAEKGNASIMLLIAGLYAEGLGVEKNEVESKKWIQKAIDGGLIWLISSEAKRHEDNKEYEEALKLYKDTEEKTGVGSMLPNIAMMYQFGTGVPRDYVEAIKYYKKAWHKGNLFIAEYVGELYGEGGHGIEKNYAEAAKWYKRSTQFENYYSPGTNMNKLGLLYQRGGFGIEKNDQEAVEWYRKSAEKGYDWGMYNLATMYENGYGVRKDNAEAVKWYRKAAEKGNEDALKALKRLGQ